MQTGQITLCRHHGSFIRLNITHIYHISGFFVQFGLDYFVPGCLQKRLVKSRFTKIKYVLKSVNNLSGLKIKVNGYTDMSKKFLNLKYIVHFARLKLF